MSELIKKYDEVYDRMVASKDPMRMMAFGESGKEFFHELAEAHPELAAIWMEKHERTQWDNYLSEEEARHIVESLEEKHGDVVEVRYEWDYDTLKSAVESMGGKVSHYPHYNCYALWATMNMLYSDHVDTVNAFIQPPIRVRFYYKLATDKLKDVDRPHFVREYFHLNG